MIITAAVVGAHQLDLPQRLLDRLALADDAARVGLDADFFLEIGVLELEPLTQAVDLGEGCVQLLVGLAALADVAKHHDGADHDAAVADRGGGVFDPGRRAVLAPKHLAVNLMHGAVAERRVDRTVMVVIVPAIVMGVVHDGVDLLADQLLGGPAQHAFGRGIDEGGLAFRVHAIDAFAGGAQDQLVLALDVLEHPLDPLPGRDAAAHVVFGGGIDIAAPARVEIGQCELHQRAAVMGQHAAGIFQPEILPGGMAGGEHRGPIGALVQHGLGEHGQGRKLAGVQGARPGLPQQRAVVAEQGAGGRIGIDDLVGIGVDQQRGLDRGLERGDARIDRLGGIIGNEHWRRCHHEIS
ncbi:hypothetical protein ABIF35_004668 [Bradyrhizobium japonicum]